MQSLDWATWAGVVALLVGIAALVISLSARNQAKKQADEATAQTSLMEESNQLARAAYAAAEELKGPDVAWALEHHSGHAYLLVNVGHRLAYDVRLDCGDLVTEGDPSREVLRPGDAIKFIAVRTLGTSNDNVTVTWADRQGGTAQQWRRPLPPKP